MLRYLISSLGKPSCLFKLFRLIGIFIVTVVLAYLVFNGLKFETLLVPILICLIVVVYDFLAADQLKKILAEDTPVKMLRRVLNYSPDTNALNVPAVLSKYFTGRQSILLSIKDFLDEHGAVLLYGMSGVGKSQIALRFAHENRSKYKNVIWLDLESRQSLLSSLRLISDILNLSNTEESLRAGVFRGWLATEREWLLILDNISEPDLFMEIVPSISGGHIILTSNRNFDLHFGKCFHIMAMEEDEGALLLLRRSGVAGLKESLERCENSDVESAQRLSRKLGGVPLVIDQAGAYLSKRLKFNHFGECCDLYEMEYSNRLSDSADTKNRNPVESNVLLLLDKFRSEDQAALEALELATFYCATNIPTQLLFDSEELGRSIALQDTINCLESWSLMIFDGKTFGINSYLQSIVLHSMDQAQRKRIGEKSVSLIAANLRKLDSVDTVNRDALYSLMPHTLRCVKVASEAGVKGTDIVYCFQHVYNY